MHLQGKEGVHNCKNYPNAIIKSLINIIPMSSYIIVGLRVEYVSYVIKFSSASYDQGYNTE